VPKPRPTGAVKPGTRPTGAAIRGYSSTHPWGPGESKARTGAVKPGTGGFAVSESTPELTPESTPETAPATTPPPAITPAPTPPTFTHEQQAEIARLVGKARDEGKRTAQDEARRKHAEDEAKAKGEWEKVATDRQTEIERLTGELAARDRALLVAKVAARHRLPETLATRLVGTTEEELETDAKALAKEVGARAAPETEAGAGSGARGAGPGGYPADRPPVKRLDGPVYGFGGQQKVPWPGREPTAGRRAPPG
jgi:hypothetical protein